MSGLWLWGRLWSWMKIHLTHAVNQIHAAVPHQGSFWLCPVKIPRLIQTIFSNFLMVKIQSGTVSKLPRSRVNIPFTPWPGTITRPEWHFIPSPNLLTMISIGLIGLVAVSCISAKSSRQFPGLIHIYLERNTIVLSFLFPQKGFYAHGSSHRVL